MSFSFQPAQPAPSGQPQTLRDFLGLYLGKNDQDFQHLVDFVVIDLQRDLLQGMYLTPALAKRHPNPLVKAIYGDVRQYFERIRDLLVLARQGSQLAEQQIMQMLTLPEANEIAMGYTRAGWQGNGFSPELAYKVLYAIPELAEVACDEPDVITFIPGISLDRMSDLIATVGKRALTRFTISTAQRYRFDGKLQRGVVQNVWDFASNGLGSLNADVLSYRGRVLLLVPKHIVRSSPPMRVEQYADFIGEKVMAKADVLVDIASHPGRLRSFVNVVMAEEWRYRPRRKFRG